MMMVHRERTAVVLDLLFIFVRWFATMHDEEPIIVSALATS